MHHDRKRFVIVVTVLLAVVLTAACGGLKGSGEELNKPPVYEGPGCYDNKGRFEPTIRIKRECDEQNWVWKMAP